MLYYPGPQGISPLFTGKYIQNDTSLKRRSRHERYRSPSSCVATVRSANWKGLILCLIGLNLVPLLLAAAPPGPPLWFSRGALHPALFRPPLSLRGSFFIFFVGMTCIPGAFCDISTFSVNCGEQENRGTVFVREGRSPAESLPGNGPLVRLGAAPERGTVCPPLSGL